MPSEAAWLPIDRHPPGVDVAFLRTAVTPANLVVGSIFGAVVALLVGSAPGIAWFHLVDGRPAWLFAAWPLSYLLLYVARDRILAGRALALLDVVLVHGVAMVGSLGAASRDDFGVGWSVALLLPPCWGHIFPKNRTLGLAMFLVPPLERLAFVPGASARSMAYAAALSGLVAAGFWAFSHRRLRVREWERRDLARRTLGAESAADAAALLTSMRLHDGLSGLLVLSRARAARGSDADALAAGRSFAHHARAVIATFGAAPAATFVLDRYLEDFAHRVGLDLALEIRGGPLPSDMSDLRELLVELLANQARHGSDRKPKLSIESARKELVVRLSCVGASANGGGGRGLRNLALRAEACGGVARQAQHGDSIETRIELPLVKASRWSSFLFVEALVHLAAPFSAWLCGGGPVLVGLVAACSLVLAAIQMRATLGVGAVRADTQAGVRSRIDDASGPALELVQGELGLALARLETSVDAERAADARAALQGLSHTMEDLLFSFEAAADPGAAHSALDDFARTLGQPPIAGSRRNATEVYEARRELRRGAHAINARVPAGAPPAQPQAGS